MQRNHATFVVPTQDHVTTGLADLLETKPLQNPYRFGTRDPWEFRHALE
jgi:hypothetical protein